MTYLRTLKIISGPPRDSGHLHQINVSGYPWRWSQTPSVHDVQIWRVKPKTSHNILGIQHLLLDSSLFQASNMLRCCHQLVILKNKKKITKSLKHAALLSSTYSIPKYKENKEIPGQLCQSTVWSCYWGFRAQSQQSLWYWFFWEYENMIFLQAADDLNPIRVQELFMAVPDEDCELLDLAGRPEDLIMTSIPVPPVCIRPSVEVDGGGGSNEDDITVKLGVSYRLKLCLKLFYLQNCVNDSHPLEKPEFRNKIAPIQTITQYHSKMSVLNTDSWDFCIFFL